MLRITRTRKVSVLLQVSANVTTGKLTEAELAEWVEDAVARYHLWRAGHVGLSATASIQPPSVVQYEPEA